MMTAVSTAAVNGAVSVGAGIAVTLALILLIVFREFALAIGPQSRSFARVLLVAVAPFTVLFAIAVVRHLAAMV